MDGRWRAAPLLIGGPHVALLCGRAETEAEAAVGKVQTCVLVYYTRKPTIHSVLNRKLRLERNYISNKGKIMTTIMSDGTAAREIFMFFQHKQQYFLQY